MGMDMGSIVMMMMMNDQAAQTREENRRALEFQNSIISDTKTEKKAEQDRIDRKDAARKTAGEAGRGAYISNVKQRVSSGLIGEESAQKLIQDYYTNYDLTPATDELTGVTEAYQQFAPKKRAAELNSLYQRSVGRPATCSRTITDGAGA